MSTLCELMSVNRSGYYKWKNRKDKPNRYEQDRTDLTRLLQEQHQKHKTYGYHFLAQAIRNETGWVFSDNLAHKCCKEAGIKSTARKTYHHTRGRESERYPNVISGNWNATKPLEIVVSDMTELKTRKHGRIEWTYMLDTYNNEIIASALSTRHADPRPYFKCLDILIEKTKEQKAPVILHTDQGAVYSSRAFRNAHKDYTNIHRSMSRVGTPTDNPIIEAINGWVKEELYKDFKLRYCEDIETLITEYIDYYNTERPSTKCGLKSPVQFRTEQGFT